MPVSHEVPIQIYSLSPSLGSFTNNNKFKIVPLASGQVVFPGSVQHYNLRNKFHFCNQLKIKY
jgi:hypothetical protein